MLYKSTGNILKTLKKCNWFLDLALNMLKNDQIYEGLNKEIQISERPTIFCHFLKATFGIL